MWIAVLGAGHGYVTEAGRALVEWSVRSGHRGSRSRRATDRRRSPSRAIELDVAEQVVFTHADASNHVADDPADIGACIGATWIGGGVADTVNLLRRSPRPGGMMLVSEPFWRREPPDQATIEACHATSEDDFRPLPDLLEQFGDIGCDVERLLADQDSWNRYAAAQRLSTHLWLDIHPDDALAEKMRTELASTPTRYARYQREYLGSVKRAV